MLGLIQKILLTLTSIVFALAIIFGFYIVVFEENNRFEYEMLILLVLAVFAILSFVFHLKTLKFYKIKTLLYLNFEKDKPFWLLNGVFALSLFILAVFFLYQFSRVFSGEFTMNDKMPFIILIVIPIVLCIWLFLDARFLYRNYKMLQAKAAINTIDDIKGVEEDKDASV